MIREMYMTYLIYSIKYNGKTVSTTRSLHSLVVVNKIRSKVGYYLRKNKGTMCRPWLRVPPLQCLDYGPSRSQTIWSLWTEEKSM